MENERTYSAFSGHQLVASGPEEKVLVAVKTHLDETQAEAPLLVFEDQTGQQIDFDLRGTARDVVDRLSAHPHFASSYVPRQSGPGRPKLGVVSREVSLLPRHWEWLETQKGGASVMLRKLIDDARKRSQGKDIARQHREAASKFMWAMTGSLPNFEEATRALFAKDDEKLAELIQEWPQDLRSHVTKLTAEASRWEREAPV